MDPPLNEVKKMKVNKTQGVLFIYSILLEKKAIKKEEIMNRLGINKLTFFRYIQELRSFLYNFNCCKELIYEIKDETYYLCEMCKQL